MPYVQHILGKTHYTRRGRGRKTPVIWLHGGPGGMHKPDGKVFTLAKERMVYCYTQIGGGKSSRTEKSQWQIKTFVDELELLVEAWGLTEFHLMGGSWGTSLALEYYLRKRGKGVRSLVFQSPLFSAADWKADARRLIKGLPPETRKIINTCHDIGATDASVYKDATKVFYLKHVLRNRNKLNDMFERKNPNGNRVYEYMWGPSEFQPTGTLGSYDRIAALKRIKIPAMIICGEFDEATPETGVKYANQIPGCSFAEIKGASHVIWEEKPARINKVITEFLADVEAS
jgi:proline iminopeptidase